MSRATESRLTDQQVADKLHAEKIRAKAQMQLQKDMCETFATEHGKRVLTWLKDQCCYQISEITANPATGEINEKATLYNAIRRTLYMRLRKFLHRDILSQVEIGGLGGDDDSQEDILT